VGALSRHEPTLNGAIDVAAASQGRLRSTRRLLRHKDRQLVRRFLAEGRQSISEALRRPGTVLELIVGDNSVDRHLDLLSIASKAGVPISAAPVQAMTELAATVTPQGLIAVCQMVDVPADEALAGRPRLVVLCDQVRDPGNLGTVIRCADAFGADAVLVSRDSVDIYNAKAVRATTGSMFHLPLAIEIDLADTVALARKAGLQVLGADANGPSTVDHLARSGELTQPTLWVMGNEAWGLPPERAAMLDRLVALPMYGRAESLNLSTAAAVFLYASATAQHGPYL
jgi:RNA methyltransferase, TrmH family